MWYPLRITEHQFPVRRYPNFCQGSTQWGQLFHFSPLAERALERPPGPSPGQSPPWPPVRTHYPFYLAKQQSLKIISRALWSSLVAQTVKRLPTMPTMWETRVQSLGREDLLEKEMAPHSSTLPWKIPRMVEPGRLQPMESQRVGHDWVTSLHFTRALYSKTHSRRGLWTMY